jgi:hypothetical protein
MRNVTGMGAVLVFTAALVGAAAAAPGAEPNATAIAAGSSGRASSVPCTPWPAVDALGRKVLVPSEVGPPRSDRFVGIFYFLWLNERRVRSERFNGAYDVSKILAADPAALSKPDSPLWGPIGTSHYWGEPLYGYYVSDDPWVLRRHAQLLADAGIDTLIFDTTNAVTYRDVYHKLCEVFSEVRRSGEPTPQIAFMVNTQAGKTAQAIYDDLYKPGRFRDLWFHWRGKPLLICDPDEAPPELRRFFTLRRAHWPMQLVNTRRAWHWEATYPQPYGYVDDPAVPEQVNVSVAQNLRQSDGVVTNMSEGNARGRSFHAGKVDAAPDATGRGFNFQEQWKRAFDLDPPLVMVTGWNEWIAGRWGKPGGPIVFVDQFTRECSRDIEPMQGGHADNYYWQLVSNVRRYKGAGPTPRASAPATIRLEDDFAAWRAVGPEFRDHAGETIARNGDGAAGLRYVNRTGRNDIAAAKVARDDANVYFYLRTRDPIVPRGWPQGLWLLIDADQNASTGWEGFDGIVNRGPGDGSAMSLEVNAGGWRWREVGKVRYRAAGNELHLAVPRAALGLAPHGGDVGRPPDVSIDFQWADNVQKPGDVMDFYTSGDVAPEGRFRYRYSTR